jgi:hypothetical protein
LQYSLHHTIRVCPLVFVVHTERKRKYGKMQIKITQSVCFGKLAGDGYAWREYNITSDIMQLWVEFNTAQFTQRFVYPIKLQHRRKGHHCFAA